MFVFSRRQQKKNRWLGLLDCNQRQMFALFLFALVSLAYCQLFPGPPCDDENPCPRTACISGTCSDSTCLLAFTDCSGGHTPCFPSSICDDASGCQPQPLTCNDANACTTDICDETIVAGSPCIFTPKTCDDVNPCTIDSCDPLTGCVNTPKDCSDTNGCTIDSCDTTTGNCIRSNKVCDDDKHCTTDSCDVASGDCVFTRKACNDFNACTTDTCAEPSGTCVNTPIVCDDSNACTADSCDPVKGCIFRPAILCDDGKNCTVDSCNTSTGECSSSPRNCDDGDWCTQDTCNEATSACVNTPDRTICNDMNICTIDICNPMLQQCAHKSISCDDGNPCTNDGCQPLTGCANTPVDCSDNNACTRDFCNPFPPSGCQHETITCTQTPRNNCELTECDPVLGCRFVPKNCDDGKQCTQDSCDLVSGACVHTATPCVSPNRCLIGGCVEPTGCTTTPKNCNDGDSCTDDSCPDGDGRCRHTPIATVAANGECPANVYAFAIDDTDGGGIACIDFGGDKFSSANTCPPGGHVTISGSGARPFGTAIATLSFDQCEFQLDSEGHMTSFTLATATGEKFLLSGACGVFSVPVGGATQARKRQSVDVGSNGLGTLQLQGVGQGDPHFVTPWGARFDFDGEPNGNYALFTAPQLQVNMQLAATGPTTRFMTSIAVMFANESFVFTAGWGVFEEAPAVTRALEARGGRAMLVEGWRLLLLMCDGVEVEISVRHLDSFNFLNVMFATPGCMKTVGGALGHTYDCKYEADPQSFQWAHSLEESFRVAELTSTVAPFSAKVKANCNRVSSGSGQMIGAMTTTVM